jgi:hypothetical protein
VSERAAKAAAWFRADPGRAFLLTVLAFVVYNANLRVIAMGDSRPARFIPFAILRDGTLALDGFEEPVVAGLPDQYWVIDEKGHLVSLYPIVTPLLVLPLYLPAADYLAAVDWEPRAVGFVAALMEKLAASAVAAIAAGLLYLLLRRRAPPRDALLLAGAFAFATNTWATSSQALWQHGPSQLLLVAALFAAVSGITPGRLALAGLCCGLLVANRPADLPLAAAVALFIVVRERRLPFAFAAPAAVIGALALGYNLAVFGHVFGGYSLKEVSPRFFSVPLGSGIAGLLVSPGKGLFVFSPFLLFLLARPAVPGPAGDRALDACLACGAAALVLIYATIDWRGGSGYGPRFMTDLLPILIWLLVPVVTRLRRTGRAAFLAAVAVSVLIQMVGVFYYPAGESDRVLLGSFEADWKIGNAPFLLELRNGPAPL